MTRIVYNGTAVNRGTNEVVANAEVEVLSSVDGSQATIYDSRSGGSLLANPFFVDSDGDFTFYVEQGRYDIIVRGSGGSTIERHDDVVLVSEFVIENPMAASGDIIVGGTGGAVGRLGKGTDNQIMVQVSGTPSWQNLNNTWWNGEDLSIANGGTGASTAPAARTNLGLGTAATADVTTSSTDTTSGRVWRTDDLVKTTSATDTTSGSVMTTGAGGLLRGQALFSGDINTLTVPGKHFISNSAANIPIATAGILDIGTGTVSVVNDRLVREYHTYSGANANRVFKSVSGDGGTTWSSWVELAILASPAFTGTPTAPTASLGANTTQIATTAFVQQEISSGGAGGAGDVGTYALMFNKAMGGFNPGNETTGSNLEWSAADGSRSGSSPSGTSTWRCMGYTLGSTGSTTSADRVTTWLRIS